MKWIQIVFVIIGIMFVAYGPFAYSLKFNNYEESVVKTTCFLYSLAITILVMFILY